MTAEHNSRTAELAHDRTAADVETDDQLDLRARLELLEEENRRLRNEYARARQSKYRHTAYGLGTVGLLTLMLGFLFPDGREVLVTLGVTGVFGGVLTLYLTPSRFVAAEVGERTYAAMAANYAALVDQLGLTESRIYIPGKDQAAHLYIPQSSEAEIPALGESPLVITDSNRGLLLEASGALLFEEFERALSGPVATRPDQLTMQLADAIVEQFELADSIDTDISPLEGRVTFRIAGSALGAVDRIDHPLASFLAASCAKTLDRPVTLEVESATERGDWLVTLRWEPEMENN